MSRPKALLAALIIAAIAALGISFPSASSAAVSCYGGAISGSYGDALGFGPYYASHRCNDINMQLTSMDAGYITACVVFVNHTDNCNYTTYFYSTGSWETIATDVLDGTKFMVYVGVDLEGASASFKFAF